MDITAISHLAIASNLPRSDETRDIRTRRCGYSTPDWLAHSLWHVFLGSTPPCLSAGATWLLATWMNHLQGPQGRKHGEVWFLR